MNFSNENKNNDTVSVRISWPTAMDNSPKDIPSTVNKCWLTLYKVTVLVSPACTAVTEECFWSTVCLSAALPVSFCFSKWLSCSLVHACQKGKTCDSLNRHFKANEELHILNYVVSYWVFSFPGYSTLHNCKIPWSMHC